MVGTAGRAVLVMAAGVVALGGCAATTSDEERQAVSVALIDCFSNAALEVDDGKSDPVSVALGIMPSCARQFGAFEDAAAGMSTDPVVQVMIRRQTRAEEIQHATAAVLHVRQLKARSPAK